MNKFFHLPLAGAALLACAFAEPAPAVATEPSQVAIPGTARQQETIREAIRIISETTGHLKVVRGVLRSVKDKDGAETAAALIAERTALLQGLLRKTEAMMPELQGDPELAELLVATMQEVFGADEEMGQLDNDILGLCYAAKSASPAYYGSESLYHAIQGLVKVLYDGDWDTEGAADTSVIGDDDTVDDGIPPELAEKAGEAYKRLLDLRKDLVAVIDSVHDKASADTAASRLQAQRAKMGAIIDQADAGGYLDILCEVMEAAGGGAEADLAFQNFLKRMRALEPPFYGSSALQAFFDSPENAGE